VFWPLLLYVQSGACARAGRAAEGLDLIDEALEIAARDAGKTLLPEFHLLKGDLLSAGPEGRAAAEPCYRRAFEVARELDARMSQLRAATRLCRLASDQPDAEEGRRLLSAVHETFTEGSTTTDLIEAEELLATT
jgi:hypothetical protein